MDAAPRVGAAGVGGLDLDGGGHEQTLDRVHGGDDLVALARVEWGEDRPGQLVAARVQQRALCHSCRGQPGNANAAVRRARLDAHQAVSLERTQQPARVTRVEIETRAQ